MNHYETLVFIIKLSYSLAKKFGTFSKLYKVVQTSSVQTFPLDKGNFVNHDCGVNHLSSIVLYLNIPDYINPLFRLMQKYPLATTL